MKKEAGRENKKTNLRTNWRSTGNKSRKLIKHKEQMQNLGNRR